MELTPANIYIQWAGTHMDDLEATRKLAMPGIYVHQIHIVIVIGQHAATISNPASDISDSICV